MAINRESNTYTVIFAVIMVVVVGGLLAFTYESFKDTIKANEVNEKKQNILQAIGISETAGDDFDRKQAAEVFDTYVKRRITLSYNGEILSDKSADVPVDPKDPLDAFNIDLRKEYKLYGKKIIKNNKGDAEAMANAFAAESRVHYPLFVCQNKTGDSTFYVIPAVGTGLWDDIWGYVGIQSDCSTINGAVFDHKAETPGLGSKIAEDKFEDQFKGKQLRNDEDEPVALEVKKPGNELDEHEVDGISGATFTGVGVADMLKRAFKVYQDFFDENAEEFKK